MNHDGPVQISLVEKLPECLKVNPGHHRRPREEMDLYIYIVKLCQHVSDLQPWPRALDHRRKVNFFEVLLIDYCSIVDLQQQHCDRQIEQKIQDHAGNSNFPQPRVQIDPNYAINRLPQKEEAKFLVK